MRANRPRLRLGFLASLVLAGVVFLALLASGTPAHADGSFRCGRHVIRDGETEDDVSYKCGTPDTTRTWTEVQTESVWVGGRRLERSYPITYSEWKYDFGRGRLTRYLTFAQGRLRDVKTGAYGR